ncbi:GCN5-like 1 domain protein (macronuclear) [Tetrahymena thermophila SB210]|uniref:Biogenesis of lysosome-related organelles complex 1 subunit 1 n=1 Tax=Tetrahymena thermophila (strain SB210) TaxID=312017 RepID=I7LT28_TETTS|nr:GCN5-like 1 domain protein [Tetrahymena thermophila SB210]EAR84133.2 GCN5-like 1 domain protein [Tetrahymena thermophila SB210]|eukprot:XP_001031796.2 GCN5-like 1 domain protein [Tetrahymena thermophila SB210]
MFQQIPLRQSNKQSNSSKFQCTAIITQILLCKQSQIIYKTHFRKIFSIKVKHIIFLSQFYQNFQLRYYFMFDGILKEYEKSKKTVEKENELLKKEIKLLSENITKKVLIGVNSDVQVLHSNQKIIEKETKELKSEVSKFYKEVQSWTALYDDLNGALKELGDVVNWAGIIEKEFKIIVEKMEEQKINKIQKQQQQQQQQQKANQDSQPKNENQTQEQQQIPQQQQQIPQTEQKKQE